MAVEEVFELNGEWVVKTACAECEAEIHSPMGTDGQPSEIAVKAACSFRRLCEECLDREEAARKAAADRKVRDRLIVESKVPAALRGLEFATARTFHESDRNLRAVDACEKWARGEWEKRGLYLVGGAGVGKTYLAATAAWARLLRVEEISWCSVAQLMGNLNRAFGDRERRDALSVLLGDGPLVLDDFDKVKPSEFGTQQIFTAIDSRVQAGVPLIVTANLRLGEVVERYGEPIGSRLAGHCTQLVLDGPDRRLELG
jgi:DNA replication protein DnaC